MKKQFLFLSPLYKKIAKFAIPILVILFIIGSCKKNQTPNNLQTDSKATLKEWYTNYVNKLDSVGFLSSIKPNRDDVYENHNGELLLIKLVAATPAKQTF